MRIVLVLLATPFAIIAIGVAAWLLVIAGELWLPAPETVIEWLR